MPRSHREAIERVVVVRALHGIGDMVCLVPALRALRRALPRAHVTLIGLPSSGWFVERFPTYVDELLVFPGFPGFIQGPPTYDDVPAFLAETHRRRFDLAIQMQGSGMTSNAFTSLLGARTTTGFGLPGLSPDGFFLPYPADEPEIRRHLRLMEFLGIAPDGEHLEWPVRDADRAALDGIAEAASLAPGRYVVLHPGACDPKRRWPPTSFAAVADALAADGLTVVLTGSDDEAPITGAVARSMRALAVDLTGRTSLGALGALVANAAIVVCNDTSISHIADALRVPSVVVFLGSRRERWAPLDDSLHRSLGDGTLRMLPVEHRCLRDGCQARVEERGVPVAPDEVLAHVRTLLDGATHAA